MSMFDPVLLFFLLGILAGLLRSELRLPSAIYELVSMLLLIAIGLKGGVEISKHSSAGLALQVFAVMGMGTILTLSAFPVLRFIGRFPRPDAASIAAHYGSVSVATYAVASSYFTARKIEFEAHMPCLLVVLEIPAIIVGILLARGFSKDVRIRAIAHEVFLGKGIVLLIGGLLIGWVAGTDGLVSVKPLFFDLFKGILALYLLEMGLITAEQLGSLRRHGSSLLAFGIVMPIFFSMIGISLGYALNMTLGGAAMLGIFAASASYIAVPAAMRISVPQANPALSLASSLGVTFPFNVLLGIPLYHKIAQKAFAIYAS